MRQIFQAMLFGRWMSAKRGRQMAFLGIAKTNRDDLDYVGGLIASGRVSPVIDRTYPRADTVAAFRYVPDEHAWGKVVTTLG